ncbi:hypothetical protein PR202_ga10917 [Eleusine coracana subsp. coracana]|uniref:Uncharacterized protein n=1 Tax=Eleusine coracana subsp. coracana TaxID=191504 RepID=A0AAV5C880_ELECO|nr:hypothetical protein PR202_ga10917 [Eleusine coracana subsp. coracana]
MEVLRLPRIWAQELSQLWQRRAHARAKGREINTKLHSCLLNCLSRSCNCTKQNKLVLYKLLAMHDAYKLLAVA